MLQTAMFMLCGSHEVHTQTQGRGESRHVYLTTALLGIHSSPVGCFIILKGVINHDEIACREATKEAW